MKSTADLFKNNELTAEAIKKMLETCDESTEYIKDNMIYCRKCNEPRRKWMSAFGAYVPVGMSYWAAATLLFGTTYFVFDKLIPKVSPTLLS